MTNETTEFKAGDLIPEWVLKSRDPTLQGEATFAMDVIAEQVTEGDYKVLVRPLVPMGDKDVLFRITPKGCEHNNWEGAPTYWNIVPVGDNKAELLSKTNLPVTPANAKRNVEMIQKY